jgi:hypothetical protein
VKPLKQGIRGGDHVALRASTYHAAVLTGCIPTDGAALVILVVATGTEAAMLAVSIEPKPAD